MDNILEFLVPLIFAAIYFFGNMFSKKSDDEVAPPGGGSRRSADEDADDTERQRRIQEEIRRKIMQRRNEAEGSDPPRDHSRGRGSPHPLAPEPKESPYTSRHPVERHRELHEQQKENRDRRYPQTESPNPYLSQRNAEEPDPEFRANPYENEMQAQLDQIRATEREAKKLKKQATERTRSVGSESLIRSGGIGGGKGGKGGTGRHRTVRRPVRSTLRNPTAARAAFIYGEVLGPPISQRKAQTVPGLSQS